MTLIEGIGDEVILFLAVAFTIIILTLLWIFPSQQSQLPWIANIVGQGNEVPQSHSADVINHDSTIRESSVLNGDNSSNDNQIPSASLTDCDSINENLRTNIDDSMINTDSTNCPNFQNEVLLEDRTNSNSVSDNPDFLRRRRLEFFDQQSSVCSAAINGELVDHLDSNNENRQNVPSFNSEPIIGENETSGAVPMDSVSNDGTVRVRLKYLNDTERIVQCKLDDKIGEFKRKHFAEDIANNKIVRLIYNGQLLRADNRNLESFGVIDNSVIHVQISQNQQQQGSSTIDSDSDVDLSHLMWPIFGIILGIVWMLHFQYREYFNAIATISLVGITGLFLVVIWSQSSLNTSRREGSQPTSS